MKDELTKSSLKIEQWKRKYIDKISRKSPDIRKNLLLSRNYQISYLIMNNENGKALLI